MKGKVVLFVMLGGVSFTGVNAEIVNYRKSRAKEDLVIQIPTVETKEITRITIPVLVPLQYKTEFIPKPNNPAMENEKIIIPMTPPSSPSKPQIKQFSQFTRPYNQKLIASVNYSSNPENPHKGIVYNPIEIGNVLSSMEGRVVAIDYMDGYHNYVILEHQNGFFTVYGNLDAVFVAEGQTVKKGEVLGNLIKEKGLYFQVNQGKKTLDPISLIKS